MTTASRSTSGEPFEILLALDEWRHGGVVSARGMLPHIADAGATAVKVIACQAEQYSTRSVRVTHTFPAFDARLADIQSSVPAAPAPVLAAITKLLGGVPLVVAPYDLASFEQAAAAGVEHWQVDEAMNANLPLLDAMATSARRVYFCTWGCSERELATAQTVFRGLELVWLHRLRSRPSSASIRDCAMMAHLASLGGRVGWIDTRPNRSHAMFALASGGSVAEVAAGGGPLDAQQAASRLASRIAAIRGLASESRRDLLAYVPDELDQVDDARPGLVAACAIQAGTILSRDMIALRAPAVGLSADQMGLAVGRKALYDLRPHDPLTFGVLA
jgi:sialic acid synthase SpsE